MTRNEDLKISFAHFSRTFYALHYHFLLSPPWKQFPAFSMQLKTRGWRGKIASSFNTSISSSMPKPWGQVQHDRERKAVHRYTTYTGRLQIYCTGTPDIYKKWTWIGIFAHVEQRFHGWTGWNPIWAPSLTLLHFRHAAWHFEVICMQWPILFAWMQIGHLSHWSKAKERQGKGKEETRRGLFLLFSNGKKGEKEKIAALSIPIFSCHLFLPATRDTNGCGSCYLITSLVNQHRHNFYRC